MATAWQVCRRPGAWSLIHSLLPSYNRKQTQTVPEPTVSAGTRIGASGFPGWRQSKSKAPEARAPPSRSLQDTPFSQREDRPPSSNTNSASGDPGWEVRLWSVSRRNHLSPAVSLKPPGESRTQRVKQNFRMTPQFRSRVSTQEKCTETERKFMVAGGEGQAVTTPGMRLPSVGTETLWRRQGSGRHSSVNAPNLMESNSTMDSTVCE